MRELASGFYSGFQHQLLDEPELTKERFIELCDKWFYHLDRYEIKSVDELEEMRLKDKKRLEDKITEYQEKLTAIENSPEEQLRLEYQDYVEQTEAFNQQKTATYEKEIERYHLIKEYAEQIRPALDYIWKELKEPSLYLTEIIPFQQWVQLETESLQSSVQFYQQQLDKFNERRSPDTPVNQLVADYEEKKKKFLEEA